MTASQFDDYGAFLEWLTANYPPASETTARGNTFQRFAIELLPETASGRPFGPLVANPKKTHDFGVDILSVKPGALAVQSKFSLSEKAAFDSVFSQFLNYESRLQPDGQLFPEDEPSAILPVYGLVTASRLGNIIEKYEASSLASRAFYDRLVREQRLIIWDGEYLRRSARELQTRHFQIPLTVALASASGGWLNDGRVWIGIVEGEDLVQLEAEHGRGLFFENLRGFEGLGGGQDDETVNQAIRATVLEAPDQLLARNNGITLRAKEVMPLDDGTLELREASIINGRQTTGVLAAVGARTAGCRVQVKVVEADDDAWSIAEAANNQNRVARIELRLARYFREHLVRRDLAAAATGTDWLKNVVSEVRDDDQHFELLRSLLVGLFCQRPGQLADNNYSHIRFDVLDAFYESGEPPANLFPTLDAVAKATDEAVAYAAQLSDVDPLANVDARGRPKYRAFLALLTLCATHDIDLSQPLDDLDAEVASKRAFIARTAELVEHSPERFQENFLYAYLAVGLEAQGALGVQQQQQLHQRVFRAPFAIHLTRTKQQIQVAERRRSMGQKS